MFKYIYIYIYIYKEIARKKGNCQVCKFGLLYIQKPLDQQQQMKLLKLIKVH